jgi:copper oxidase (laccase) domain-containing protein
LEPLRRQVSKWETVLRDDQGDRARLDLKALIRTQARECGIRPEHITAVNLCTVCHENLFFSYRREGKVMGTMVSAIGLIPAS